MNESTLRLTYIEIEQPGGTFYYTKVKAFKIIDRLDIKGRTQYEDGIQRDLNKKRTSEIAEYLSLADAVLPTPIVISSKSVTARNENELTLELDQDGTYGEIIDGQHRYEGLRKSSEFLNFDIPLCIFVELSTEDKASIFSTINSTQVKVPKSYIYDLFSYSEDNTPIKFAHNVCKTLNYEEKGPLFRHIKMLGKKLHDNEVLSQAAFVDAIIPAFSTDIKKDTIALRQKQQLDPNPNLPLRALYIKNDTLIFSKLFSNYMRGLQAVSGETWKTYILKSIGIKVFARLFSEICPYALRKGNASKEYFSFVLQHIQQQISECTTAIGTNKPAEESTFEKLRAALPDLDLLVFEEKADTH
ncbi:DGQHR domain-containing protein [Pseudomonas aeruginosa]|uniref:DGQHR domain-containing protein n=1 Tax=Pseudomonas aeruginosa TaxID=287 RepID=UPI0018AAA94D|nr:DGQHR domain-containing protein [Pseudomonas aeruginosa]MBF8663732.1 DGQHR domain-containing protein [Pseudomonas aeruginosa]MBF8683479.1 DGQHR domain-containing protein [Pseudomonas aeruginosa]